MSQAKYSTNTGISCRTSHLAGEGAAVAATFVDRGKSVQEVDAWHTDVAEADGAVVHSIQTNLEQQQQQPASTQRGSSQICSSSW